MYIIGDLSSVPFPTWKKRSVPGKRKFTLCYNSYNLRVKILLYLLKLILKIQRDVQYNRQTVTHYINE